MSTDVLKPQEIEALTMIYHRNLSRGVFDKLCLGGVRIDTINSLCKLGLMASTQYAIRQRISGRCPRHHPIVLYQLTAKGKKMAAKCWYQWV